MIPRDVLAEEKRKPQIDQKKNLALKNNTVENNTDGTPCIY